MQHILQPDRLERHLHRRVKAHIRTAYIQRAKSSPPANAPSRVAFEYQFGQDSLPFIAPEKMVVILVPILFAPAQNGSNLAAQERGSFGRDEGAGKAGERAPLRVVHLPALAIVEQGDGVARASVSEGNKRRVTYGQATRKGQVHEFCVGRNIPQAGARQGRNVGRDTAKQDRLRIRSDKRVQTFGQHGQAMLGPRHRNVEQAAGGVGILISGRAIPAAVQDGHMVELQPLCAVRGQQQEPALLAPRLARSFTETLHKVRHWCRFFHQFPGQ